MRLGILMCGVLLSSCVAEGEEVGQVAQTSTVPTVNDTPQNNELGAASTVSADGFIDPSNPFFADLGTNGRTCVSCHGPGEGWTISPAELEKRFKQSDGLAPVFRLVDGGNTPNEDVSTVEARREAFSMLLSRGVIRVGIGIPANAEFELISVDDPYGYASAAELSLFRRPLPSMNLGFISSVMWDGRESPTGLDITTALQNQSNGATLGHAQAAVALTQDTRAAIQGFESALFNAQRSVDGLGDLTASGGKGGALVLANQPYVAGPMDLYDAWHGDSNAKRAQVARGQDLFNDACQGCHNAANVGSNINPRFFNIQVSSAQIRTPDEPLYTLRNTSTGEIAETTDPGRALITGLWSDLNRFKVPNLRALGARAPYFHNGSAKTLEDVVRHYEEFLNFNFTDAERADLVVFLGAL